MKKLSLIVFLALATTFVTTSCSKEGQIINRVEGSWDITSYQAGGVDLLGTFFSKSSFEFGDYDKKNDTGDVDWSTTISILGIEETEIETGTYSIGDKGETLTLTLNGESGEFDLEVDKNNLMLSGVVDSVNTVIEATRIN